jgi:hypothetical protein
VSGVFSKLSRYAVVPQLLAPDPQGRVLPGTDFRALPAVTGTFKHVVRQGDRLDQLSSTYYSRPLIWWNICDANPATLSPLALVGAEPVLTTVLPFAAAPAVPGWAELVAALSALPGVLSVDVHDDVELDPAERPGMHGGTVTVHLERAVRSVSVTHNVLVTPPAQLGRAARDLGWTPGAVHQLSRVGHEIVVPPTRAG